ncbi:hypothetical protein JOC86_001167 [Bacillus pakistanensis]|uniref:Uncharacterized protein n=1 Tax=Rossellomorea pakistanensis TaxID=992288 RepID=A0ABS2N9V1_9BACI|nr:hypothetical protein [Bacillus pakistanensis]
MVEFIRNLTEKIKQMIVGVFEFYCEDSLEETKKNN